MTTKPYILFYKNKVLVLCKRHEYDSSWLNGYKIFFIDEILKEDILDFSLLWDNEQGDIIVDIVIHTQDKELENKKYPFHFEMSYQKENIDYNGTMRGMVSIDSNTHLSQIINDKESYFEISIDNLIKSVDMDLFYSIQFHVNIPWLVFYRNDYLKSAFDTYFNYDILSNLYAGFNDINDEVKFTIPVTESTRFFRPEFAILATSLCDMIDEQHDRLLVTYDLSSEAHPVLNRAMGFSTDKFTFNIDAKTLKKQLLFVNMKLKPLLEAASASRIVKIYS